MQTQKERKKTKLTELRIKTSENTHIIENIRRSTVLFGKERRLERDKIPSKRQK